MWEPLPDGWGLRLSSHREGIDSRSVFCFTQATRGPHGTCLHGGQ